MHGIRALAISILVAVPLTITACRWQSSTPTESPTGEFGSGSGDFTVQCSGDFADWISDHPPVADSSGDVNPNEPGIQKSFQLAQSYPLGIPVFVTNGSGQVIVDLGSARGKPRRALARLHGPDRRSAT